MINPMPLPEAPPPFKKLFAFVAAANTACALQIYRAPGFAGMDVQEFKEHAAPLKAGFDFADLTADPALHAIFVPAPAPKTSLIALIFDLPRHAKITAEKEELLDEIRQAAIAFMGRSNFTLNFRPTALGGVNGYLPGQVYRHKLFV